MTKVNIKLKDHMRYFTYFTLLIITLTIFAANGNGQTQNKSQSSTMEDTTAVEETTFAPNKVPELTIPRISEGMLTIDGKLDEDIWKSAAVCDNFTEIAPGDNIKPEVETITYVMYDDDNIYFGFVCYDDMKNIRASMTDRDRMYSDDWIGPFIDTYGNMKEAFEFYVTPYGIQGDLFWTPNYEDSSPDYIFSSEAHIYSDRWTAEMKIPFKSLKFPDKAIQEWRVHILRNRPRNLRQRIYWASVSRDDPNFLGQSGKFKGIENVKGGNSLEILPYVLGQQKATLNSPFNTSSNLDYDKLGGEFGFDVRYGLTSNIGLDATYNPDFSQVEADAPQIDINQPFALFFSEKRPFFLEGINAFRTQLNNMVYTRSINNPILASKITGKEGKWSFGFLTAYDENTPFIVPLEERSYVLPSNKYSLANILRVKYDMGGEDYIGALLTDREFTTDSTFNLDFKGYNRSLSLDFRFNFLKNFYFGGMISGFATREITDTDFFDAPDRFGSENQYTAAFDGEAYNDYSTFLFVNRQSDNYGFWTEFSSNGPTVRRDLGFLTRNGYTSFYTYHHYNIYPDSKIIRRITPDITGGLQHNYDGIIKDQYMYPGVTIEFHNGTRLWGNYIGILNNETYGGQWLTDIKRWNFGIENYAIQEIGAGMFYEAGRSIVRFGSPPYLGYGQYFEVWSDIKPIDRIVSSFHYSYQDLGALDGNSLLFAGWVLSNTTRYQFNKNLFVRLVFQYDQFSDAFSFDPLVSYKWNPFTVLYVGSTHNFEQVDDATSINNRTTIKERDRTIFLKFQYLWQL
jgi:hypothetical protein